MRPTKERLEEIRKYRLTFREPLLIEELLAEIDALQTENQKLKEGFEQWKKQYLQEWGQRKLIEKERDRLKEQLKTKID